MTFQLWEIPGGQTGEGYDTHKAILQALGSAVFAGNIEVSPLEVGTSYDLTVYALKELHNEEVGITVVSDNLAFGYGIQLLSAADWQSDHLAASLWPRLLVMPEERPYLPLYHALWEDGHMGTELTLFGLVRHVESTPSWTAVWM